MLQPQLDTLPDELILHICSFLEANDLLNLRLVNRQLSRICDDHRLWRHLFSRHFLYSNPVLPDEDGWLHFVDPKTSDNAWRMSYQLLQKGVQIYPEDDTATCLERAMKEDPNAIILLHSGHHVLRRPLFISSSVRILGLGSESPTVLRSKVCLEVQSPSGHLILTSPHCKAQLTFLTIGFKQIGPQRAPLMLRSGARPLLSHCVFVNSSQSGWALVASDPETQPTLRQCSLPDNSHNGVLLCLSGGRFEEIEFGQCSGVCLQMIASSATFDHNWIRPGNVVAVCKSLGTIGGEVLPGLLKKVHVVSDAKVPETLSWRIRAGWQYWDHWPDSNSQVDGCQH